MQNTIYVSLPSYRDKRCSSTLHFMFSNADCPHLIRVGVLDQSTCSDSCTPPAQWRDQVRRVHMQHNHAKGPLYARQLLCNMYQGEAYYMMIDAHMHFAPHWDTKLIQEHTHLRNRCGVEKAHYQRIRTTVKVRYAKRCGASHMQSTADHKRPSVPGCQYIAARNAIEHVPTHALLVLPLCVL